MMKIEVLGTGCAKCKRLFANLQEAVKDLGVEAERDQGRLDRRDRRTRGHEHARPLHQRDVEAGRQGPYRGRVKKIIRE